MSLDGLNVDDAKVEMLALVKDGEPSTSYTHDELIRQFLRVHEGRFQYTEAELARKALFDEQLLCHGQGLKCGMVVSAERADKA